MDISHKLTRAAGAIGSMTLISRVFGFVRDLAIATTFGSSAAADAFFVAFRIPNIQRRLLGEGGVSAAFIPVLSDYLKNKTKREVWAFAGNLMNILLSLLGSLTLAIIFFAPEVITVFAPGFIDQPEKFDLTVLLTRTMAPFLIFIGLSAFCMGVFNTLGIFALPASAPIYLNLSMIGSILFISPRLEEPIMGLAYGVIIGGVLQCLIQFPVLIKKGFHFSQSYDWRDSGVVRVGKLMGPAILGLAVYEVNLLVDTLLASLLKEGSISYLYYANRLVQLPLGIFGVALGTALLPTLSMHSASRDFKKLKESLAFSLRLILFITLPATVGLMVLRYPIVQTLWERGQFLPETTQGTAYALLCYAVGLCAFSGTKIAVTAYYSLQDTKTPMKIAIWSMLLNVILNLILIGPMGHGGLALATSLSALFNGVLLIHFLRKRLGNMEGTIIIKSSLKYFLLACIMGSCVYFLNDFYFDPNDSTTQKIIFLSLMIFTGTLVYGFMAHLMQINELKVVLNLFKKKPLQSK